MNEALGKVIKRLHYPLAVMLTCVRWYVAYPLSLRHIEEMMAERGVVVDHATIHRWSLKILPVLAKVFRRSKRSVGRSWRMDETYIKIRGRWCYLYRAVDRAGDTVDFVLTAHRDEAPARRFLKRAISTANRSRSPSTRAGLTPRRSSATIETTMRALRCVSANT
jgi:putative transposase